MTSSAGFVQAKRRGFSFPAPYPGLPSGASPHVAVDDQARFRSRPPLPGARRFMVEEFELSHRISEDEIFTALGNPPEPYFGGLPPTEELLELISARINLDLRIEDVEYQINLNSRYGSDFRYGLR